MSHFENVTQKTIESRATICNSSANKAMITPEEVREFALARLSRRESSAKMLQEYLEKKGATQEQAQHETERLQDQGYLSDTRFTRMFVRELLLRKKGAAWIKRALKQKGVSLADPDLRELINELEPNAENHGMVAIVERKYSHWKEDFKIKQKATRALLSRGYSYPQIQKLFQDWGTEE